MYQLSIPAPRAPEDSYNPAIAQFGEELFNGKAKCASCHVPPLFTEPGHNIRRPEEIGIDSFLADRGPTGGYRTTPLMGAWARSTGGYYHDGRFTTLNDVVNHYNQALDLNLTNGERQAIVEYINSL
jgi:cytochrome c peroxidase